MMHGPININYNSTDWAVLKILCCRDLCVMASYIAFRPIVAYFEVTKITVRLSVFNLRH